MNLRELRNYIIEFIGSFLIVLFTCLSMSELTSKKINLISTALINGFIVAVCTWSGIAISQSHFNPVITLTQLFNRKMNMNKALIYIVLQLLGSIFAALVVVLLSPDTKKNEILINFPYPNNNMTEYQIFVLEFIFSFFYVANYFSLIINEKAPSNVFGFGIGGVVAIAHLTVGPFSGACINPIRFIGPALLTEQIKYFTIYVSS